MRMLYIYVFLVINCISFHTLLTCLLFFFIFYHYDRRIWFMNCYAHQQSMWTQWFEFPVSILWDVFTSTQCQIWMHNLKWNNLFWGGLIYGHLLLGTSNCGSLISYVHSLSASDSPLYSLNTTKCLYFIIIYVVHHWLLLQCGHGNSTLPRNS